MQTITKFFLFMNLDMADRNSAPEDFACIWQSKQGGIITTETEKMWIHCSSDVFVAVSCRVNSLILTKAWSMQVWMPVVSSSLYFWKSVFSFRVDSILKWRVHINPKFPDCTHFFSAWARQAVIESLGNLRTTTTAWSTTTGSELHCTAQARLVDFVVVVSSTTPNKVESRRPAIHKLRQV